MSGMHTIGLILAGGASRRFGGRDKAWFRYRGRPLACHAIERLAPQVDRVVASANRHGWAWRRLGVDVIADDETWRGRGPLAAIASAFTALQPTRLAIVPVDAPQAPVDHVARLVMALDAGAPAAALVGAGRRQPMFALLSDTATAKAQAALAQPASPSMQAWLDAIGATWVEGPWSDSAFANINTPEDLAAWEPELPD